MARQKKWNNQGGSGRGDNYRKPKKDLPNIPSFEKLPESNTISFRLVKPRNPKPDYGEFGDEFWTDWQLLDDPSLDISDYKELDEDAVYDNLELSEIRDTIREVSGDTDNPDRLYASQIKSKDLLPSSTYKEYEIVVKYKKLILTILSGQAYACRNNLNNPLLDFSLVIASSESIQLGQNPGGTLNIIQLLGTTIDPAFALYNWVLDKLKIVTNNDGDAIDPILQRLPRSGLSLPPTSFVWNGDTYNLFNSSGKEPTQICLHAINDILKFEPSTPKNASWKWSVLVAGEPRPMCIGNVPVVSIALAPGSADELEAGSGFSFVFRISIDPTSQNLISVLFGTASLIDPIYYTIAGTSVDEFNNRIIEIPANTDYVDVSIEPLVDPSQTTDLPIVFTLLADYEDRYTYDLDNDTQIVIVKVPGTRFIGINNLGTSPRKLIYAFDVDLSAIASNFSPPINPSSHPISIDIISGSTESNTSSSKYWKATGIDLNPSSRSFYSIDKNGVLSRTSITANLNTLTGWAYLGKGTYIGLFALRVPPGISSNSQAFSMVMYDVDGIDSSSTASQTAIPLQPIDSLDLNGRPSPAPGSLSVDSVSIRNYYREAILNTGFVEYSGGGVFVRYKDIGIRNNSKLPILLGQKTITVKFETTTLLVQRVVATNGIIRRETTYDADRLVYYFNANGVTNTSGYFSGTANYNVGTTVAHSIDNTTIDAPLYGTREPLNPSQYSLSGNIIQFSTTPSLNPFLRSPKQIVEKQTQVFTNNALTSTTKVLIDNPVWNDIFNARFVIFTDRIQECEFDNISLSNLTLVTSASVPESELWALISAPYRVISDRVNNTSYRGLIFISVAFLDTLKSNILASPDCLAKIYRTLEPNASQNRLSLFAFEFWIQNTGRMDFKAIHERALISGELSSHSSRSSLSYYP